MGKTWIMVTESSRARLFRADTPRSELRELEDYAHPEGRMHSQDLTSDRPGRSFDSGGQGRHAMGQKTDPTEQEQVAFARDLCERLEAGRVQGAFENLILIAPPGFLGHLRKGLGAALRSQVILELGKNLVAESPAAVRQHIRDELG